MPTRWATGACSPPSAWPPQVWGQGCWDGKTGGRKGAEAEPGLCGRRQRWAWLPPLLRSVPWSQDAPRRPLHASTPSLNIDGTSVKCYVVFQARGWGLGGVDHGQESKTPSPVLLAIEDGETSAGQQPPGTQRLLWPTPGEQAVHVGGREGAQDVGGSGKRTSEQEPVGREGVSAGPSRLSLFQAEEYQTPRHGLAVFPKGQRSAWEQLWWAE